MAFDPRYFDPDYFECDAWMTWQYFEPDEIKATLVSYLRAHVKPLQTLNPYTIDLYVVSDNQIAQGFYPFSTQINSVSVYMSTIGTPTGSVSMYITEDNDGEATGTTLASSTIIPSDVTDGWVTKTMSVSNIKGKNLYWIKLETTDQDSSNYYEVRSTGSDDSYFEGTSRINDGSWSAYGEDLAFQVHVNEFIFKRYPSETIDIRSYPRIAVEVYGRPRVGENWISKKIMEYEITLNVILYSRYPKELDMLTKFVDRAMFKNRDSITPFRIISPARITPVTREREYLYVRGLDYGGLMYVYR